MRRRANPVPGGRDLALLAAGQAVSVAGDSAALVALLLRLRPEGSGWVAALLAAELVPFVVCAPLSGRAVDRFETRAVLLAALIGQGIVAVPLALASPAWATVALFACLNVLATLVRPATSALVPAVTGADAAARGYARLATGQSLGWIAGPAAGGVLTGAIGTSSTLLIDAATFGMLALAAALVRARRRPVRAATVDDLPGAGRGGLRLLWQSSLLRVALFASAIAIGCAVVDNVAAPFRFVDQLGTDDTGYGLYLTLWGVGAFTGVQLMRLLRPAGHAAGLAVGNLLTGLGIAGIGVAPDYALALVASGAGGLGNGLVNVAQNSLVAAHTPEHAHGRVFAAAGAVVQTAIGVGTAIAAPLVAGLGAGHAMLAAGTLTVVVSLGALVHAQLLRRRQAPVGTAATEPLSCPEPRR